MRFSRFLILPLILSFSIVAMAQDQSSANESPEVMRQQIERMQRRLQDWPQLNRYKEANAEVPTPDMGESRVVFMGDSITDGWKLDEYFPGKPYINRGISGQTTPQMLIRFRPDVVDLKPAAVLILAGTNDIAGNTGPMTLEQIESNYASIAELAREQNQSNLRVHSPDPQLHARIAGFLCRAFHGKNPVPQSMAEGLLPRKPLRLSRLFFSPSG